MNSDATTFPSTLVESLMGVLATLSDAACYATGQLWSQILELCDARGFSPTLAASIVNNLQVLTVREDLSDQGRMSAIFTSNSRQVLPYTENWIHSEPSSTNLQGKELPLRKTD